MRTSFDFAVCTGLLWAIYSFSEYAAVWVACIAIGIVVIADIWAYLKHGKGFQSWWQDDYIPARIKKNSVLRR